ncbi:hypothetical protein EKL28_17830, partial [Staphylococcus aureus]
VTQNIENERLFRVEFPERPGALLTFLERLGPTRLTTVPAMQLQTQVSWVLA